MNTLKRASGKEPTVNSKLILVVEDHPLNQKVAVLLLERMGFQVNVAGNGLKGVELAKRNHYDAILMDCHMPEMDGFDATRTIRQHEKLTGEHVPIIALTALAMAGDRERCLSAGMDDYVAKPIDRDLLRDKLVYWMNPGTMLAINNPKNVIQIFDEAFAGNTSREESFRQLMQFHDAYGDEAPDLLRLFIHSCERSLDEIKVCVESTDASAIGRLAHELKGASWAVGADEMARLSVFLEQAAGQENWRVINRTVVRLTHHFDDLNKLIQNQLANLKVQPELQQSDAVKVTS